MLIESLVLALIISILKGGRLQNFSRVDLRGLWLIPVAYLVQAAVYWASVKGFHIKPVWLAPLLYTLSYLLIFGVALSNHSMPGMRWIALGVLLNGLVIGLNSGLMPVDPAYLTAETRLALLPGNGTHGLMSESTRLAFLADRIFLYIPGLGKQLFSIGDVLIDIGIFSLVPHIMTKSFSHRIRTLAH